MLVRTSSGRPSTAPARTAPADVTRRAIVALHDELALDASIAGAKAASLARATAAGLPVLSGFVLSTSACASVMPSGLKGVSPEDRARVHAAWSEISADGELPVVVRSSSTVEDGSTSSMAGRFTSVLGVRTWTEFVAAVDRVVDSARILHLDGASHFESCPIAVLVQPELSPASGGVAFGVDPVTGRDDAFVASVGRHPDEIVSGRADGERVVISRRGRVRERSERDAAVAGAAVSLSLQQARALARLCLHTERVFGARCDIEWAFDRRNKLWLLQARPITAVGAALRGPVLGPGPAAETFPCALTPLEQDLWLDAMRDGIRHALSISRAASARRIAASPVAATVGGWACVDLELLGAYRRPPTLWSRIDPRPPARRLASAWRTGRLRAALPELAANLLDAVDRELESIPRVADLDDTELLTVIRASRRVLVSLHAQEVLAGLLLSSDPSATTGAGAAIRALAEGGRSGLSRAQILANHPEVLALTAPSIGAKTDDVDLTEHPVFASDEQPALVPEAPPIGQREALRLRIRWTHELTARAARELGRRLAAAGALPAETPIEWLRLGEVIALARNEMPRKGTPAWAPGPPVPECFRLTVDGVPVSLPRARHRRAAKRERSHEGQPASAGRGVGAVVHDSETQTDLTGAVLVVRHLDPSLATRLPGLAGLVAETGSVLSHLAILAREFGVPTVVGVSSATERFPVGGTVLVDGSTGEVRLIEQGA